MVAVLDSSRVTCPVNPGAMNPAVEWVSSPRRPRLVGGAQDELTGVQDEGLVGPDVDQMGQPLLVGGRVDDRVAVVVEETEPAVQAHIDGGRLNHLGVVGVEDDPPGVELGADIAV